MKERRKVILDYAVGLAVFGFILLTVLVYLFPFSTVDLEVSRKVQHFHSDQLDPFMRWVSWFGVSPYSLILPVAAAILFRIFKYRREALFTLTTLLAGIVSTIVKYLINRPRPAEPFVHILEQTRQQSFPSGHVNFYVVFFGFLVVQMWVLKSIPVWIRVPVTGFCSMLILIVPFSRIYLGAHWFTDVLGGALMGIVLLYVNSCIYLKRKI